MNRVEGGGLSVPVPILHQKLGVVSRIFYEIACFFARLKLLIVCGSWYTEAKIRGMVSEAIQSETTHKVQRVYNALSKYVDCSPIEPFTKDAFSVSERIQKVDDALLFQIHADEFGANNKKLEGLTFRRTIAYLIDYFKEKRPEDQFLISKLEKAHALIDKEKNDFIKRIQENKDEFQLIPGGWVGLPAGHAILYEVIKENEESVTLRIFNLGAGAESVIDPTDYKPKGATYLELKGILRTRMMDDTTLQAIYEMRTYCFIPPSNYNTSYGAQDIYQGLISLLEPASMEWGPLTKTMQRSGVCSWRSLMAYVSSQLPADEYKKFICDIKLQSLATKVWKEKDPVGIKLVERAYAKTARRLTKLYQKQIIERGYCLSANTQLNHIRKTLREMRGTVYTRVHISNNGKYWENRNVKLEYFHLDEPSLEEQSLSNEVQESRILHSELIHLIQGMPLEKALVACLQAKKRGEYHTVHIAIQKYVRTLDIPEQKPNEMLACQLGALASLYFDTCFLIPEATIVHAERIVTLEILRDLQIKAFPFKYEKQFCLNNKGFYVNPLEPSRVTTWPGGLFLPQVGNNIFIHNLSLTDQFPEAHDELHKLEPEYIKFEEDKQSAYIYMSELTPEWFRCLRNTSLYIHYLTYRPVGRPADGTTSFHLTFEYKHETVEYNLKEISENIYDLYPQLKKEKAKFLGNQLSSSYRPFKSTHLNNYVQSWIAGSLQHEKRLLSERNGLFYHEEFEGLPYILLDPKHYTLLGYEYFYRHPEKLVDPDYQTLFELIFFKPLLKKDLTISGLNKRFDHFFETQIQNSLKTNELQKCVFLIRMTRLFHCYNQHIVDRSFLLPSLLNRANEEEKSVIYAELCAAYAAKEKLTDEEIDFLLIGNAYLKEYPVPMKWNHPHQNKEVLEGLLIHSDTIKKRFDQSLLDRIVNEVFPDGLEERVEYNTLSGKIVAKNKKLTLPQEIVHHPHFIQNFKGVTRGVAHTQGIYSFIYLGYKTFVKMGENNRLIIDQKRGDVFYRFVAREAFFEIEHDVSVKSAFFSRYLCENYSHWRTLGREDQVEILDSETLQTKFIAKLNKGQVVEVRKAGTNLVLSSFSDTELKQIEHYNYIQEWHDGSKVAVAELPRYGLSFVKNKEWCCDQFKDYFIASDQTIYLFEMYGDFLVLENKQGKKKVILPIHEFKALSDKNAIEPYFFIQRNVDKEVVKKSYFTFDYDNTILKNPSLNARLYLAAILSVIGKYNAAAFCLKQYGYKISKYTSEEESYLKTIASVRWITGDSCGNSLALQVYASYLLLKKGISCGGGSRLYIHYLEHLNNVTFLKLTKEEEIFLLKHYLNESYNITLAMRLEKLISMGFIPVQEQQGIGYPSSPPIPAKMPFPQVSEMLFTRIGIYFWYNPEAMFQLVKGKTADDWLAKAFRYGKARGSLTSHVFDDMRRNPDKYESSPGNLEQNEALDWLEEMSKNIQRITPISFPKLLLQTKIVPEEILPVFPQVVLQIPPFVGNKKKISEGQKQPLTSQRYLEWLEKERTNHDPLFAREIERLSLDIIADPILEREVVFANDKVSNQKALETLKQELLERANQPPEDMMEQLTHEMELKGGIKKVITLHDLLISFAKQDPRYSHLYSQVGTYLLLATHEQQRERGTDLAAEREYDPEKRPAFLVFEYFANLMMRKDQVEKLEAFLENGDTGLVLEIIMGSGKSKVLLPLLALLKSEGKKLSLILVPEPLFETVATDTQRTLFGAFSESIKTLYFDRNTTFTKTSLEMILDDLESGILIMTNKSIQCLLLKYVEETVKQEGKITPELELFSAILRKLSHPIIDEVDTVLNVLHEVCFSTGASLNSNPVEIRMIASLYRLIYTDKEIQNLVRIESNPNALNREELTEKNYIKIKRLLAKKFLKEQGIADKEAVAYLCHEPFAQKYFDAQTRPRQNLLALAAEEISNFLPHTLTKNCDEKYGLQKNSPIAIPYSAANKPNVGSQFANPYITMNFTFQYYMKKGISKKILMKEIMNLQSKVLNELRELGPGAEINKAESYALFDHLTLGIDMPLFNFKEAQFNRLMEKINHSTEMKLYFVTEIILPQLELFEKKISCNPQNLIAFFGAASGFTGTLWNQFSMHSALQMVPELGIDSKTLKILWNTCNDEVTLLQEKKPQKMVEELAAKGITYDLITDAGGYFKEGGNAHIARILNESFNKPVVFYNRKNEQTLLNDGIETPLTETSYQDRITFLDQSHTTGSDVPQKEDAVALVTISRNMLLRDLLQSVWRLRGLDKKQRVKFVVSEEVKGIICQLLEKDTIDFETILKFAIINQARQQGKDNFKGVVQELRSMIQELLFKVMLDPVFTEEQRANVVAVLDKEWIKNSNKEPADLFGQIPTPEESDRVVKETLEKFHEKLLGLQKQLPFLHATLEVMKEKALEIVERVRDKLPAHILSPIRDIEDDQTVEIVKESQTETENELEVSEENQVEFRPLTFVTGSLTYTENLNQLSNIPYFDIQLFFNREPEFQEISDAFSGIAVTQNVFQFDKFINCQWKLFGKQRTPFHHIHFRDGKALIITSIEMEQLTIDKNYYNLGFGFCNLNIQLTPEQQLQVIKIKFLNGESHYTKKEAVILKQWIETYGKEKMKNFFCNHVLAGNPRKTALYNNNSTLKTFFK